MTSDDRAAFATYDQGILTTNRETGREQEASMSAGINPALNVSIDAKSTATLTNLMQSMKANAVNMHMPQKQAKKYHIDLGQNVSYIDFNEGTLWL